MVGPLKERTQPVRVLEIGPGTGAVTRQIVQLLRPDDRFDLVELNESFAAMLNRRFQVDPSYRPLARQSEIHVCPLQEFRTEVQYDYIISGLPLNNFSADMVREIFEIYFRLLAPQGVLSYFEYMYVRPVRKLMSGRKERARLNALDEIMGSYLSQHHFHTGWVFVNLPPAWVQHLRRDAQQDLSKLDQPKP